MAMRPGGFDDVVEVIGLHKGESSPVKILVLDNILGGFGS